METKKHGDTGKLELHFNREELSQCKKWLIPMVAATCLITYGLAVYSIYAMSSLQAENNLYRNQLRLAEEKMNQISEKVDNVERISKEVKNMVAGQMNDRPGVGGASTVPDVSREHRKGDTVIRTPGDLLAKLIQMDEILEKELKTLIGLRTELMANSYTARAIYDAYAANAPSVWPVLGEVTSPFGWRESTYGIESNFHEGVDIATNYDVPVRVTADGMVTYAGWVEGYGYFVEVSHAGGIVTRYGHNSSIVVYEGQIVHQGDTVALAGSTGNSTGPHTHYEVRVHGKALDPMLFLK